MDFTREPIIESIITPREGFRIVVRSSKNVGHEEYFVDALEIIAFGHSVFFRSKEKPKPFMVPACDYEIFEVREPRLILKTPSIEGTVKISSQKETQHKFAPKSSQPIPFESVPLRIGGGTGEEKEEIQKEKYDRTVFSAPTAEIEHPNSTDQSPQDESVAVSPEAQHEKKRERRNRFRKKKGAREEREEIRDERKESVAAPLSEIQEGFSEEQVKAELERKEEIPPPVMRTLLPPPTTLIRDDIERLRKDETFKGAFFMKDDKSEETEDDDDDVPVVPKRLVFEEEETGDTELMDVYKATPAKSSVKEVREPFWIPPSVLSSSEMKNPE